VKAARRGALLITLALAASGCGGSSHDSSTLQLPNDYRPIPSGRGPQYRLPALSAQSALGRPIDNMFCTRQRHRRSYAIHLELYARGLVLPIPAGIGVAPPLKRRGAYVASGRCAYPIRTLEPTGLVLVDRGGQFTIGGLFAIWGKRIGLTQLASFTGPVFAYVNGHHWVGPPERIPLREHAQIVLEADGYVPPHPSYTFPPGL
jgi:hypothetical protein